MSISISSFFDISNRSPFAAEIKKNGQSHSRAMVGTSKLDVSDLRELHFADETCFQSAYENFTMAPKIEFAVDVVAQRKETANQIDNESRYQIAKEMALEYTSFLYNHINKVKVNSNSGNESPEHVNPFHNDIYKDHITTYSSTTKNGTIVNISQMASDLYEEHNNYGQAVQITRTNGLQVNLELNDDLRINELDDGCLTIYFASSGITKHFSVDGIESIIENGDSPLGTNGDDIIINKYGSEIISGDGDDIIFNFADNTVINAGDGNDKILICNPESSGVHIDTGDGRDIVAAYSMKSSIVNLNDDDFLVVAQLENSAITATGNVSIKAEEVRQSSLSTDFGKANLNLGRILESAVSIGDTELVTIGSVDNSDISLESSDEINAFIRNIKRSNVTIYAKQVNLTNSSLLDSDMKVDATKANIISSSLGNSNLATGDGEDTIKVYSLSNSTISTGGGNDYITFNNSSNSKVFSGTGNDTIKYNIANWSQINQGSGKNTVIENVRIDKINNKNLLSLAAEAWNTHVMNNT